MKKLILLRGYFTKTEKLLWLSSCLIIIVSFLIFDRESYITLSASLLGVTSLIYNAKGNPFGQLLMVIFSLIYGYISYSFSYFGEMITYMGMTGPMAFFALVSWLKNPYEGNRSEVRVNTISKKEAVCMLVASAFVTVIFYFILEYFGTANILYSTLSVTTSFIAVYLTFRRSPYFALVYALNDIVLIILWVMATEEKVSYMSVVICFVIFLVNDIYGFVSWKRRKTEQKEFASY